MSDINGRTLLIGSAGAAGLLGLEGLASWSLSGSAIGVPGITQDAIQPGEYDDEWVVVLDDWVDGTGRTPGVPATLTAKPGQRVRIRIINTGSDTAFRLALGSHWMTVTHSDGFPVEPVNTDALLIGMGERYDVRLSGTMAPYRCTSTATTFITSRVA